MMNSRLVSKENIDQTIKKHKPEREGNASKQDMNASIKLENSMDV
jgi:hypothetical protein